MLYRMKCLVSVWFICLCVDCPVKITNSIVSSPASFCQVYRVTGENSISDNNEKFRSFKSKENIHKKEVGPYCGFGY